MDKRASPDAGGYLQPGCLTGLTCRRYKEGVMPNDATLIHQAKLLHK